MSAKPRFHPEDVILHVYNLTNSRLVSSVNYCMKRFGAGLFHVGVEVHGFEWSFGWATDGSGIFWCAPAQCIRHNYRGPIHMGKTTLRRDCVQKLLSDMSKEWHGQDYSIVGQNCCTFSESFCQRLGVGTLPSWVKRMSGAAIQLKGLVSRCQHPWLSAIQADASQTAYSPSAMDEFPTDLLYSPFSRLQQTTAPVSRAIYPGRRFAQDRREERQRCSEKRVAVFMKSTMVL